MMQPLQVLNLSKSYVNRKTKKTFQAVNGVSFEVQPGEIFGLLGPNGAGKTTIISTISTLEAPSSGNVLVFGNDVQLKPKSAKMQLGVVPQEIINQGFFSLVEILNFHSGYFGIRHNKDQIEFLLKRLGLWEHRSKMVKELSGGMKRRMMIAKALVHKPKLLLLDEPTAGVDIELRSSLWEFVAELKNSGVSVLLTTHYLQEAEQMCDRIGILNFGKLEYLGKTSEIIKQLTQTLIEIEFFKEVSIHSNYLKSKNLNKYTFQIPSQKMVGEFLQETQVDVSLIKDIRTFDGNLEDAFKSILKSNLETSLK
jgi:ABC-2 type transport system ATP-binding protein